MSPPVVARLPLALGILLGALLVAGALPQVIDEEPVRQAAPADPGAGAPAGSEVAPGALAPEGGAPNPSGAGVAGGAPAAPAGAAGDGPVATSTGAVTAAGAASGGSGTGPVRLGIVLFDIGAVSRVGVSVPNFSPDEQRAVYQVFVDDLNERGGLGGRRVEAVYRTYDVLSPDDMRAACLRLTEDDEVFAVLDPTGAFYGPPVVCVTEEHRTPFLSSGSTAFTDEMFRRSAGRLFTVLQRGSRVLANQVAILGETGMLAKGATIGVLFDTRPGNEPTVRSGLIQTLRQSGYEVAVEAALAPDNATSASQMPVIVQRMRQAGVDTVFLAVGTLNATQFVQAADQQLYRPSYRSSDWFAGSGDNWAQNMPASFEGSIAVTAARTGEWRVDAPEPPADARCRSTYTTRAGVRVSRADTAYGLATSICNLLGLLEAGARGTEPLVGDAVAGRIRRLGRMDLANIAGGSFSDTKTDAADHVRLLRWEAACKCWKPATPFRPAAA